LIGLHVATYSRAQSYIEGRPQSTSRSRRGA